VGRIALAAGTPSNANPPQTAIYAQLASASDASSAMVGVWRSTDSGATFVSATGAVANPTTSSYCVNMNVTGAQAWYNLAIAVDPADSNRVILGGNYCGVRTRNGLSATPAWENVAHWLPAPALGIGNTAAGTLPYVHADWHFAQILRTGSGYRVIAGTDGGIFYSDDVFTPDSVTNGTVTWKFPNRGLVTHLAYSVASGDPANGNPFVAYMGMQDNGTRFRDSPAKPTTFNQVIGGDGFGATVATGGNPATTVYWGSVNGRVRLCNPGLLDCNTGTNWYQMLPTLTCPGDALPFIIRYSAVSTDPSNPAVVVYSNLQVFRSVGDPFTSDTAGWVAISPCAPTTIRQIHASQNIDGVIGVATNSGKYWVTSNCQAGNNACTWTWAANSTRFDVNGDGTITTNEQIFGTASITFPPTTPAGKNPGDVYVTASLAPTDTSGAPVSAGLGHVFLTQDRGTTWVPLKGNGTGFDLPNVPTSVVRYDPGDLTNNTIYAGTDLGIYRTTDGGQTWHRFGMGMPLVKVTDLFISKTGNLLRASTYGRGMWEIYPSATAEKGVNGNGDFNRDQQIDFVDLAATAARLGTDPSSSAAPYYEWNLDQVGSTNGVDDSDLSRLLTRFGGRP
ncbi:MAG TPA: hypothetical protein VK447_08180, partial [Myxococcaceae bacterium]|nr:hypothetical protein [Myxococcaceae bacterium]